MDEKVYNDIVSNFKNAAFNDLKILSGLLSPDDLEFFVKESISKLYKSN